MSQALVEDIPVVTRTANVEFLDGSTVKLTFKESESHSVYCCSCPPFWALDLAIPFDLLNLLPFLLSRLSRC